MENILKINTAKELVFKAYCHGVLRNPLDPDGTKRRERFENWWAEHYSRGDHKDSFHAELNVYVEGKRYIQAE